MKRFNLNNFTRGWIIGDFEPTIIRSKDFEVCVRHYKKGEKEPKHFHNHVDEITVITLGKFRMNNIVLEKDDIVWVEKKEAVDFECLEDGTNVVIKIPSVAGDKFIVEK